MGNKALYGLLRGLPSVGFESCLSGENQFICSIMVGSLAGSLSWNKLEFRIFWSSVVCFFFYVIHATIAAAGFDKFEVFVDDLVGFRELLLHDNLLKRFSLFERFSKESNLRSGIWLFFFCLISIILHVLYGRCRGPTAM